MCHNRVSGYVSEKSLGCFFYSVQYLPCSRFLILKKRDVERKTLVQFSPPDFSSFHHGLLAKVKMSVCLLPYFFNTI